MLLRGYNIVAILYFVPVFLISLTIHELSHAYISYKLGDPTAKDQGRLTINPIKHLDPFGAIMFMLVGIGWAKPVPINPMFYTDRRKGMILTAFAGPLSNILLALFFAVPMYLIGRNIDIIYSYFGADALFSINLNLLFSGFDLETVIFNLCRLFYVANIMLAVFNMLPVPPLDGSRILSVLMPQRQYYKIMQYEQYIIAALFLIIFIKPELLYTIMSPFIWFIETAISIIVTTIY